MIGRILEAAERLPDPVWALALLLACLTPFAAFGAVVFTIAGAVR